MTKQVNIYRAGREWCYALFVDGEFDTSDTLGLSQEGAEDEDEAVAEAREQFPGAEVVRVADCAAMS